MILHFTSNANYWLARERRHTILLWVTVNYSVANNSQGLTLLNDCVAPRMTALCLPYGIALQFWTTFTTALTHSSHDLITQFAYHLPTLGSKIILLIILLNRERGSYRAVQRDGQSQNRDSCSQWRNLCLINAKHLELIVLFPQRSTIFEWIIATATIWSAVSRQWTGCRRVRHWTSRHLYFTEHTLCPFDWKYC